MATTFHLAAVRKQFETVCNEHQHHSANPIHMAHCTIIIYYTIAMGCYMS